MERKNEYLLHTTDEFMRGELDNVTVLHNHIVLDNMAGSYVPYGCYTSAPIPMPEFDALRVSWNASTPSGTVVEMQARVMVDGNWLPWCGFGKWSPYIRRESAAPLTRGPLVVTPSELLLDSKCGTQVQLRIYLYTQNEKRTPAVRLLAASVRCPDVIPSGGKPVNAALRLPPYSLHRRAPQLQDKGMDLACALASLTNRWWADILPEELALAMRDWREGSGPNLAFAAAAAGCWGFPAWVRYTDLAGLREDIREGHGAIVRLTSTPAQQAAGYPEHRFAALRGFSDAFGKTAHVLLNDPCAPTDFEAEIAMPVDDFMVAWNNVALTVRKRLSSLPDGCPARSSVMLRKNRRGEAGHCLLFRAGVNRALPDEYCGTEDVPTGVLAWTGEDTTPHATTAHKEFHFIQPHEGGVLLEPNPENPTHHTVYAIDSSGSMLVGDITL